MNTATDWLLAGEPYVRYRTYIDLLDLTEDAHEVKQARAEMISHPLVRGLLSELEDWPGGVINNHKKADLLIHKLAFLADLGLTVRDPGVEAIASQITKHLSEQGRARSTAQYSQSIRRYGRGHVGVDALRYAAYLLFAEKNGCGERITQEGNTNVGGARLRMRISVRLFSEDGPFQRSRQADRPLPLRDAFDACRAAADRRQNPPRIAYRSGMPAALMGVQP